MLGPGVPSDWILWGLALALGFPLLIIVLGEIIHRLEHRGQPLAAPLRIIRNLVLPVFAVLLFFTKIVGVTADTGLLPIVHTLLWILAIHASLSVLNILLFTHAEADTWRARVPQLFLDLSRFFLVLFGAALVLSSVWGADLRGLLTALGVGSIVIGLALQDTLGNLMSGIALLFEKPFQVGDWLKVGDKIGRVTEMNWRAVRLQTRDGDMLVVPNLTLGKENILNYSRPDRRHIERVTVGFSYDDQPNKCKRVLSEVAQSTPGVLSDPPPVARAMSYDDSSIAYEVLLFMADYADMPVIRERFVARIWYAARRNGMTIPFPIRTLYRGEKASVRLDDVLDSMPSYIPLDEDVMKQIDKGKLLQRFGAGELVIDRETVPDDLYVILSGEAVMTAIDNSGAEREITRLTEGDFFGAATFASESVAATSVKALDDLEVLVIDPDMLGHMLRRTPKLAREIDQVQETRRKAVHGARSAVLQ
ncbi:MAG: mechanosensitive ion channel domain-containing protein [Gammaproteobacteria bacterium]